MCVSPVSIADSKPQQVGTREGLTAREEVKVEFGLFAVDGRDDGVAGVVAAGAPRADVELAREDINKLSLACRVRNLGQYTLWGSCPRSAAGARLCPFGRLGCDSSQLDDHSLGSLASGCSGILALAALSSSLH